MSADAELTRATPTTGATATRTPDDLVVGRAGGQGGRDAPFVGRRRTTAGRSVRPSGRGADVLASRAESQVR